MGTLTQNTVNKKLNTAFDDFLGKKKKLF